MYYLQTDYNIRLEWGLKGVEMLAPISDIVIIIDVLSFSTCIDIATSNGALVYPYKYNDNTLIEYAEKIGGVAAKHRNEGGYTLSPASLTAITRRTKLVLPSPNGSTLSLATGDTLTLCGCLRNAKATAEYAMTKGKNIAIIPAGERWQDGSLRPAIEDITGAGAIISNLQGTLSSESKAALAVYNSIGNNLEDELLECISGRELIEKGFKEDVFLASKLNVSSNVPVLKDSKYTGVKI